MRSGNRSWTRRDLIVAGSGVAALTLAARGRASVPAAGKSRVVLIRDPRAVRSDGKLDGAVVQEMLDAAVVALVGAPDVAKAFGKLVSAADVVGIKSNGWWKLPTPPEVENALRKRVLEAGVAAESISVADQSVLRDPVFQKATALINTRPMRTHHWAGLGTLIKNYIMFEPNPSSLHPNACEALGSVWHYPIVAGKTRLNVLVMLTPQFHGVGPHSFNPAYVWSYGGLVVSRDPVAADTVGASIITAKRREHFGETRPIAPPPHHITFADEKYGLGSSKLERIELVKLGETKGCLI